MNSEGEVGVVCYSRDRVLALKKKQQHGLSRLGSQTFQSWDPLFITTAYDDLLFCPNL